MQVTLFKPQKAPIRRWRRLHPRSMKDVRDAEDAFYEDHAEPLPRWLSAIWKRMR